MNGEVVPPSSPLTGPTAPGRPVCAPGCLSTHYTADIINNVKLGTIEW
jgi:hypothetical protein